MEGSGIRRIPCINIGDDKMPDYIGIVIRPAAEIFVFYSLFIAITAI